MTPEESLQAESDARSAALKWEHLSGATPLPIPLDADLAAHYALAATISPILSKTDLLLVQLLRHTRELLSHARPEPTPVA